jgi:hypothetical protein
VPLIIPEPKRSLPPQYSTFTHRCSRIDAYPASRIQSRSTFSTTYPLAFILAVNRKSPMDIPCPVNPDVRSESTPLFAQLPATLQTYLLPTSLDSRGLTRPHLVGNSGICKALENCVPSLREWFDVQLRRSGSENVGLDAGPHETQNIETQNIETQNILNEP